MSSNNKDREAEIPETELPETEKQTPEDAGTQQPETKEPEAKEPEAKEPEKKETPAPEKKDAASPEALLRAEKDRYLRLAAEYDNYRKRSSKERESIYSDVKAETVAKFLPVFDNLERALAQPTEDEAYRKGVELIMAQFREVLKKLGVTEIEAVGKSFDPNLHNAVMHEESEEHGENEIVQEFQKGFKIGDKVIRFSVVKTVN